jgi:hypothetical protein
MAQAEDVTRKVIRELIMHENELFHQRRSYFAVLQGLLWTAAGLVAQSDSDAKAGLIIILAGLGSLLAVVLGISMEISSLAIDKLLDGLPGGRHGDIRSPTPVIGFYGFHDTIPSETCYKRLIVWLNGWNFAKYVFTVAWIGFAVVFSRN